MMPNARWARRRQSQGDQTARTVRHCDERVYARYTDPIALRTALSPSDADVMRRGDPVAGRATGRTFPSRQGVDDALGIRKDLVRTATAHTALRDLFQLNNWLKFELNKTEMGSDGVELAG